MATSSSRSTSTTGLLGVGRRTAQQLAGTCLPVNIISTAVQKKNRPTQNFALYQQVTQEEKGKRVFLILMAFLNLKQCDGLRFVFS